MEFVAIDFDASCLPRHGRSFPIDVGVSSREGMRNSPIRPDASWRNRDWTAEAIQLQYIGDFR